VDTLELIRTVSPKLNLLGSAFYFDGATLARGKELGLDGFRFYFLGRGGVLGDVEAPVITSAFGYFHPSLVDKIWTSGKELVAPREAGRAYAECAQAYGRARFAGIDGLDAFCAAAEAVVAATDPAGLALFAGWAAEPLPDDGPGRAGQLAQVLREQRGSVHLVAVLAQGLTAEQAHYLRRPNDYAMFGYDGDRVPDVTDDDRARLTKADELTDQLLVPAFSVLDDAAARAFAAGVDAMEQALAG
jgi:hypothetical protein